MYLPISRFASSIAVFGALLLSLGTAPVSAQGLRKPTVRFLGMMDATTTTTTTPPPPSTTTTKSQSGCILDSATCGCADSGQSDYRGTIAKTVNGRTCQAWNSQSPQTHNRTPANYPTAGLDSNYCRNPDGEPSAWCYTTDPNVRWEFCAVPVCPTGTPTTTTSTAAPPVVVCSGEDPLTCGCAEDNQATYRGTIAKTNSGRTCQAWGSQSPHAHSRTPANFPDSNLVSNYCRNPDGEPSAWCYTTDPNVRWEYCSVPVCSASPTTAPPPATTTSTAAPPVTTTVAPPPPVADLRQFLYDEINRGEKYIVVPPGVYRVQPESNKAHLTFSNLRDVTIVAYGVEMICLETTRAINIYQCTNFKIQGLSIDFDPLPFTQGRITQLSSDKTVHTIELSDGYPTANLINGNKYEIFRPDTRTLRFGSYYSYSYTVQDSKNIKVTRSGSWQGEQVGDIIAISARHAPGGSIPHAIYVTKSDGAILEDVTLWSGNMFGFFETYSTRSQYIRCTIDRRPLENDYTTRADARIRSNHADAFHSKFADVGPKYDGCKARFMADDAVAINGSYDMVMATSGSTIRVLGKDNDIHVQAGDPLEIISFTGERLNDAQVVSVTKSSSGATQAEIDFLYSLGVHSGYQDSMRSIWNVVIDRSITLPRGSLIAASNRLGNGFVVTNCDFGYNRSRGILVKASQGLISNNRVEGSVMEAIRVAPEYWWLEAGSSIAVSIVGNTIDNSEIGIEVAAQGGNRQLAPAGAFKDITIQNNIVRNTSKDSIKVTSTNGLLINGNTVDKAPSLQNCINVST